MPLALDRELRHRAQRYGMTLDQFVIALLSHLAWRTPFAEDLEPWEDWLPDELHPSPGGWCRCAWPTRPPRTLKTPALTRPGDAPWRA